MATPNPTDAPQAPATDSPKVSVYQALQNLLNYLEVKRDTDPQLAALLDQFNAAGPGDSISDWFSARLTPSRLEALRFFLTVLALAFFYLGIGTEGWVCWASWVAAGAFGALLGVLPDDGA